MVAALEAACADSGPDEPVQLVVTMAVPSDEVLYVVFGASSTTPVLAACSRAGLPPQRVTADVDARIYLGEAG